MSNETNLPIGVPTDHEIEIEIAKSIISADPVYRQRYEMGAMVFAEWMRDRMLAASAAPTDAEIERMALEEYPVVPIVNLNDETHVEDLNDLLRDAYKNGWIVCRNRMSAPPSDIEKQLYEALKKLRAAEDVEFSKDYNDTEDVTEEYLSNLKVREEADAALSAYEKGGEA